MDTTFYPFKHNPQEHFMSQRRKQLPLNSTLMCTREYYMCNLLVTPNRNASIQMISHVKHTHCRVAHTLNEIIL